jgi:hypothetical protein
MTAESRHMRVIHPLVAELTVHYETFTLLDEEQALSIYHVEPGSASEEALGLLASWSTDATGWPGPPQNLESAPRGNSPSAR